MNKVLIQGATVVNEGKAQKLDVRIQGDKIVSVGMDLPPRKANNASMHMVYICCRLD